MLAGAVHVMQEHTNQHTPDSHRREPQHESSLWCAWQTPWSPCFPNVMGCPKRPNALGSRCRERLKNVRNLQFANSQFARSKRTVHSTAMQVDSENKAIIVGGGYAGLAAAVALHKVVDKSSRNR